MSTWELHQIQVFEVAQFLNNPGLTNIYAIDSNMLTAEEKAQRRLNLSIKGLSPLETELRSRNAIRTIWPRGEFHQLRAYMETCLAVCARNFDAKHSSSSVSPMVGELSKALPFSCNAILSEGDVSSCLKACGGSCSSSTEQSNFAISLMYERNVQHTFVLRKCADLGIPSCWRSIFFKDVETMQIQVEEVSGVDTPFYKFLINLFPQLKPVFVKLEQESYDFGCFLVNYSIDSYHTNSSHVFANVSTHGDLPVYRCLGTLMTNVSEVLSR
jgi:hypothetical protein